MHIHDMCRYTSIKSTKTGIVNQLLTVNLYSLSCLLNSYHILQYVLSSSTTDTRTTHSKFQPTGVQIHDL